jgi:ATP-dependent RNA helicase DeaD
LRDPNDKKNLSSSKNGFDDSVWFELSVGKEQTAEPRWLVAMLCKAGNLSKRDIGSIKIQPKVTLVEISEKKSDTLKALSKDKKPIERHILVKILTKPPEFVSSSKDKKNRFKKRDIKSIFKTSRKDGARDFKGKRKSDRWRNSDKLRTKKTPSADDVQNEINVSLDTKSKNKKSLSRRKKQKLI